MPKWLSQIAATAVPLDIECSRFSSSAPQNIQLLIVFQTHRCSIAFALYLLKQAIHSSVSKQEDSPEECSELFLSVFLFYWCSSIFHRTLTPVCATNQHNTTLFSRFCLGYVVLLQHFQIWSDGVRNQLQQATGLSERAYHQ